MTRTHTRHHVVGRDVTVSAKVKHRVSKLRLILERQWTRVSVARCPEIERERNRCAVGTEREQSNQIQQVQQLEEARGGPDSVRTSETNVVEKIKCRRAIVCDSGRPEALLHQLFSAALQITTKRMHGQRNERRKYTRQRHAESDRLTERHATRKSDKKEIL